MCLNKLTVRGTEVSCGKCSQCLSLKRWIISARIAAEVVVADRAWFSTLTLRRNMSDALGYRLVQRWLKRVRKNTGLKVRYACVAEHGSNATKRLHYHVVVCGPVTLSYRMLRDSWRGGYSEFTLVSSRAGNVARYSSKVAKYTAKGNRFRFSQGFGSQAVKRICEYDIVEAVRQAFGGGNLRLDGVNVPARMHPPVTFVTQFSSDEHSLWKEETDYRERDRRGLGRARSLRRK